MAEILYVHRTVSSHLILMTVHVDFLEPAMKNDKKDLKVPDAVIVLVAQEKCSAPAFLHIVLVTVNVGFSDFIKCVMQQWWKMILGGTQGCITNAFSQGKHKHVGFILYRRLLVIIITVNQRRKKTSFRREITFSTFSL